MSCLYCNMYIIIIKFLCYALQTKYDIYTLACLKSYIIDFVCKLRIDFIFYNIYNIVNNFLMFIYVFFFFLDL